MELDLLSQLSSRIADLGAVGAASVVRVEGRRRGSSSGVVWSADGTVLTAHHALEREDGIAIGLPSGETVRAEVIGADATTDLALLRLAATGLSQPEWGDADSARAGELVVGISRPGRTPRVTLAAIARAAGEFRASRGGKIDRYLETTLHLHQGVSGGLVVGADGRALGVALAGTTRGAVMVIPHGTLRRVADSLLAHGQVRRGYLGIATVPVPLPPQLRAATGEHVALLVSRVDPDSPAARAGIVLGDALLSFGGATLQDASELLTLLAEDRIGDTIPMKLLRGGEVRDVEVTIGARPEGARS